VHETGTRDYFRGALWLAPTLAAILALVAGSILSSIDVPSDSWLDPLLFQGTADDARALLIGISGTMMTVIALVLGLTLVALQLSSTQFSPRLLRHFLRDRTNQLVLSVFVATFVYATAGLYTVGISEGQRVDDYPRLAVTLAILLLFGSLLVLVYFVHHVAHSIQVDEVMAAVERNTMAIIEHDLPTKDVSAEPVPERPVWAVPIPAHRSGWVQTADPEPLLQAAIAHDTMVAVVPMVGEYVIKDAAVAWAWRASPEQQPPTAADFAQPLQGALRIGYERTAEQDVAFGMRQLADIAVKALSPAINDPYTSIQALEHIAVLLAALARRPLGNQRLYDDAGELRLVMPGRDLAYFLELATGQSRRYGASEPRVLRALIRVLRSTGQFCIDDERRALVALHVRLVQEAAEQNIAQRADLAPVTDAAEQVLREVSG
jgi:uncharacterized membrane protein